MTHAPNDLSPRAVPRRRPAPLSLFAFWCLLLLFAPFLLLAPSGCGGGGGGDDTGGGVNGGTTDGRVVPQDGWTVKAVTPVQNQRKWTILLYMNGANDLEEYGSLNLNQLETVGTNGDVNIVAQFKRMRSNFAYDDKSNGDWTGTRRYLVTRDSDQNSVNSSLLSEKADLDMGQSDSLRAFVDWGVETFPAEKYCIVLWNHGAGWRSRAKSATTRGFSYDDETGNHIDTVELPGAIQLSGGRKWELITWDSSLMQMAEVAYEIRNQGKWIVGSEESPPGAGYPYQRFIGQLAANPNMDGRAFATIIADETIAGYGLNSNITQSVLDASKIEPIAAAANALGAALANAAPTYGAQIALARDDAEYYDYRNNKDLLDFLRLLRANVPDGAVQSAANQMETVTRAAIVKSVNGRDHPNSNGLAIYIPSPNGYRRDDIDQANGFGQRYVEISFAQAAPNWQAFLAQGPP